MCTYGRKEKYTLILVGLNPKEPDHLEDTDIDSRILKGILIMRLKGTREGQMVGSCKHGDKPKGSTKCGGFFD